MADASLSAERPRRADLVIAGAGPAGSVAALLAAQAGFSVVLVDARAPGSAPPLDLRNYAIVLGSWRLLKGLGLEPAFEGASEPLHGLEAHDSLSGMLPAPFRVLFEDNDVGTRAPGETLGRMIEAGVLQSTLDGAVAAAPGLIRLQGVRVTGFTAQGAGGLEVGLSDGTTMATSLLVAADGVNSSLRSLAGIRTFGWDYDQTVLAAHVGLSRPHDGIARQRFTPQGPFALLPLQGQRANIAWYLPRAAARALAAAPRAAVEAELNARFADFHGPMTLETDVQAFELRLLHAERMVAPRVALLGDAVRRLSPIAGQGLNSGLKDAAALIEVMEARRQVGLDWGTSDALRGYEQWRRPDSLAVALAMDAMTRGFRSRGLLSLPLRAGAMAAASGVGPLRRLLAAQASAQSASLPRRMLRPAA